MALPKVFFDISAGSQPVGRVVMEVTNSPVVVSLKTRRRCCAVAAGLFLLFFCANQ